MKKPVFASFTISCLLSALFLIGLAFNVQTVEASGTIYIRADGSIYPSTGNITSVDNVTYTFTDNIYEKIDVDRSNIIVDGNGYTLQGTGYGYGFYLFGVDNVTIQNMNIDDFSSGVVLENEAFSNTVSGNNLMNNDKGIYLEESSNNIIHGNTITNARYGILSWDSDNNTLSENDITNNKSYGSEESYGIWLAESSNNTLLGNMLNGYDYNFYVTGFNLIQHMHSIDASNLVDGKPVHYLANERDVVINPSTHPEIGYLAIINSTNITVENLTIVNNGQGLLLAYTENSTVMYNDITNNNYGVYLRGCSKNTVFGNNIRNNSRGVYLRRHPLVWTDKCSNNTISQNNMTGNGYCVEISSSSYNDISNNKMINNSGGIYIGYWSRYNTIFSNDIVNNDVGIFFGGHASFNNSIFHNNFVTNTDQVSVWGEHSNILDNGYPSGGNYWSDYKARNPNATEIDDSGIWDTPHIIDENNTDRYPLRYPWGVPPTIFILSPESKAYPIDDVPLTFTVSETTDWIGYVLDGQMNVTTDGNTTLFGLSDGTHTITVYANDTAGNMGASEMVYFTIGIQQEVVFPIEIVAVIVIVGVVGAIVFVYFTKFRK